MDPVAIAFVSSSHRLKPARWVSQLESFRELAGERTHYAHESLVVMIQLQHLLVN
jgi:hypothetical protein